MQVLDAWSLLGEGLDTGFLLLFSLVEEARLWVFGTWPSLAGVAFAGPVSAAGAFAGRQTSGALAGRQTSLG
jgi:hypothetical protein